MIWKTTRALCAIALALLFSNASHAFNTIDVHVRINSSSTFSGAWDEWWGKPDQFVAIYGEGDSAQAPACQSTTVINLMFVGPPAPADWRCDFNPQRPGRLYIALYDGDGPNSDNTAGQQIDVAPGTAKAATVNLENLLSSPGTPFTFTSSGDDGTINFTVDVRLNPAQLTGFTTTNYSFRPSAGEQIVVTGSATGAPYTLLRVNAFDSAGANVWGLFGYLDTPGQTSKTFVWQGRDPNGNPLPPGYYRLQLQGFEVTTNQQAIGPLNGNGIVTVGGMLVQTIQILPPPSLPSLSVLGTTPSQKWAPDVGDLAIRVASSGTTLVTGEVFAGTSCTGANLQTLPAITVTPSFPGTMTWAGPLSSTTFPPGEYSIKLTGASNGGPTSPTFVCQRIELIDAPPVSLFTRHVPFLPEPGKTVELTARSVDPSGAPRIAGRLDVFGTVQSIPGAPPATPTTPLRTCIMAHTCTATITLPSGHSFLTWRTTAADRAGSTVADSGWRGQRVTPPANFAQATGFAMPMDVALTGPFMANARDSARSLDIVFTLSTDFDWNNAMDRQSIGDALDRFMTRLWGIEGNGAPAPTTFLARPDLVRVFITPDQHAVSWNPAANLCNWTVPSVPWADATAILHKTNCRDNAYTSTRSFSAKLFARDVIMHELHHALFGLADEYPQGDGGYFEAQPFPNVYNTLADCQAQVGREAGGCSMITEIDIMSRLPTGRAFFRLDASASDVMVENGAQRFGDVRRANWKEGVCDSGGC
jgi:hypothetical protein